MSLLLQRSQSTLVRSSSRCISSRATKAVDLSAENSLVDQLAGPPTSSTYKRVTKSASEIHKALVVKDIVITPMYNLHCRSTKNNTILSFTNPNGGVLSWHSGGSCGLKGKNRSSYEAGFQCATRIFDDIMEKRKNTSMDLTIFFKGFGSGREALQTALLASENRPLAEMVKRVQDCTPIKIGGTRAMKARRI